MLIEYNITYDGGSRQGVFHYAPSSPLQWTADFVFREYWKTNAHADYSAKVKDTKSIDELKKLVSSASHSGEGHIFFEVLKSEHPIYFEILEPYMVLV